MSNDERERLLRPLIYREGTRIACSERDLIHEAFMLGQATKPTSPSVAPSELRHAINDVGECESWCRLCRHNRDCGLNPDGTVDPDRWPNGALKQTRDYDPPPPSVAPTEPDTTTVVFVDYTCMACGYTTRENWRMFLHGVTCLKAPRLTPPGDR